MNTFIELKEERKMIDNIHYFQSTSVLNRYVQLRRRKKKEFCHLCDKTNDLAALSDCTRTQGQMIANAYIRSCL
jgi:hypothetical protein